MADEVQRASRWWMAWSLFGIAAWIGVTVAVTVEHDDPSDPAPVLRTFAIAGGVFFAVTFGAAAVQMRRARVRTGSDLYRRVAIREVSDDELRAGARGSTSATSRAEPIRRRRRPPAAGAQVGRVQATPGNRAKSES